VPDGGERSDSAEYTQRADERGDDGDRDDHGNASDLLALVVGVLSCCFGHDTPCAKLTPGLRSGMLSTKVVFRGYVPVNLKVNHSK
jgi:hypothetical protein